MPKPIELVLDTNVVLDVWLFDDPRLSVFRNALTQGRATLWRSAFTHAELQRVLAYPKLKLDLAKQLQVVAAYESQSMAAKLPAEFSLQNLMMPAGFPRCRDEDDDHFLALAFHTKADALVSRDRAVLRLSAPAAHYGVRVVDLEQLNVLLGG